MKLLPLLLVLLVGCAVPFHWHKWLLWHDQYTLLEERIARFHAHQADAEQGVIWIATDSHFWLPGNDYRPLYNFEKLDALQGDESAILHSYILQYEFFDSAIQTDTHLLDSIKTLEP
jgi:hypothetical protein